MRWFGPGRPIRRVRHPYGRAGGGRPIVGRTVPRMSIGRRPGNLAGTTDRFECSTVVVRGGAMVLLRKVIGDALRGKRLAQHRTLREVSTAANVSLGYLSEIE